MILKSKFMQQMPWAIARQYQKSSDVLIDTITSILKEEEEHESKVDYYFPDDVEASFDRPSIETIVYLTVFQEDGAPMMLMTDSPYSGYFLKDLEMYSQHYMESPFTVQSPSFVLAPDSFYESNNIYNLSPADYLAIHSAVVLQYITPEDGQEEVNVYVDVLSPLEIPSILPTYYMATFTMKWAIHCLQSSPGRKHPYYLKEEIAILDEHDTEVWVPNSSTQLYISEGEALVDIDTWRDEHDF